MITKQFIRVIDQQLIKSWSTLAVSSLTNSLSKRIQNCLINFEESSERHKKDQEKYANLRDKENLTNVEKEFFKEFGKFRTFNEQISFNIKDYCICYTQCEIISYTNRNVENSKEKNKEVKQASNDVRNGKPADIGSMITLSSKNGIKLKIVDDSNYNKTHDDTDTNFEVVLVQPGKNNQIGHVLFMNKDGNFEDTDKDKYESPYD